MHALHRRHLNKLDKILAELHAGIRQFAHRLVERNLERRKRREARVLIGIAFRGRFRTEQHAVDVTTDDELVALGKETRR